MSVTVPTVVGSAATVKLTQPKTTVDISVPKQMIVNLTRPTGPVETKLVLNRVTAKTPPGTILHVYVEAKGKPAHRKFVGTINWFIAFEREGGPDVRTVTFDITDEVKAGSRAVRVDADVRGIAWSCGAAGEGPAGGAGAEDCDDQSEFGPDD